MTRRSRMIHGWSQTTAGVAGKSKGTAQLSGFKLTSWATVWTRNHRGKIDEDETKLKAPISSADVAGIVETPSKAPKLLSFNSPSSAVDLTRYDHRRVRCIEAKLWVPVWHREMTREGRWGRTFAVEKTGRLFWVRSIWPWIFIHSINGHDWMYIGIKGWDQTTFNFFSFIFFFNFQSSKNHNKYIGCPKNYPKIFTDSL